MSDCKKFKYEPRHYSRVNLQAQLFLNSEKDGEQKLQQWLENKYEPEDAAALYNAIVVEKIFNKEFGQKVKAGNDSLIKNDVSSVKETDDDKDIEDQFYVETESLSPASFFDRHVNDDEYKELVHEFNDRLIRDLIYDPDSGVGVGNPNAPRQFGSTLANDLLKQYRNELIAKLETVVGKVYVNDETDPIQYRDKIVRLLRKFKQAYILDKITNDGKGINKATYRAYVALATFDKLLSDLGLIKINPKYTESDMYIANDRYIYVGQKTKYDQRYGQEFADVDDYTSPIIKILLDRIEGLERGEKVSTGSAITLEGFKRAISELVGWAWMNADDVYIAGNEKPLNPYKEILKGESARWHDLISLYLIKHRRVGPYSRIETILNGIRYHIFEKMPVELKNLFINQIINTVHSSYLEYVTDWNEDHTEIKTVFAEDRLLDKSEIILKNRLAYKINYYQNNPDVFRKVCENLNITVSDHSIEIKIPIDDGFGTTVTIERKGDDFIFKSNGSNLNDVPDEAIINIIEQLFDTFIPTEEVNGKKAYKDLLLDINQNLPQNLLGVFGKAIALVSLASDPRTFDINGFVFTGNEENKLIKKSISILQKSIAETASFISRAYGYDLLSVVKNLNGDNLPAAQLSSMFNRTNEIIQKIEDTKEKQPHALAESLFLQDHNKTAIVGTNIREGIKINGKVKSIEQLLPAEVAQVSIIQDFWNRITRVNVTDTNKHIIDLQPMAFADKTKQMTKAIWLERISLAHWNKYTKDGVSATAFGYINDIAKNFVYDKNGKLIFDEDQYYDLIREIRAPQFKHNVIDILNRFSKVYLNQRLEERKVLKEQISYDKDLLNNIEKDIKILQIPLTKESSFTDIDAKWKCINRILADESDKSIVVNKFKNLNINFLDETDVTKSTKGGFVLNPNLWYNAEIYLSDDSKKLFIQKNRRQKQLFAARLEDADFVLSIYKDGSLRKTFNNYVKYHPEWVNLSSGSIKLYKVRDKNGNEVDVDIHDNNIDFITENGYRIELNPILNSYFFTHNLIGQQLKTLHFGESWIYKGVKEVNPDAYDFEEDEAVRFIAQTKRAMIGGGTMKRFVMGRVYGIPDMWRAAFWDDVQAPVNDLSGDEHNEIVADGHVMVSPEEGIMENWSLQDGAVGENFKKTLYGEIDQNGALTEIKTAAFTITNHLRKHNPFSRKINIERMFKLTHQDKFKHNIDFTKYYNPKAKGYFSTVPGEESRQITETDYIYYYDFESGKYYRINRLEQNGNIVKQILQEVNLDGSEVKINGNPVETSKEIVADNFYAIDQLFGGAWCMEFDPVQNRLKTSNKNNKVSTIIMVEEGLKDKIIHYVIPKSSAKVNMKNINSADVFSDSSTETKLWEASIDPSHSGVVTNAEHNVETGRVTEMSQMVLNLIQDGYLTEIVSEIYESIGQVTELGRSDFENADKQQVIQAISSALIKSLLSNQSNIVTLADAFIKQVAEDYDKYHTELKLPFSNPSIKAKFLSVITSALSKNSLRRSYPGLGTVQAPSYGYMQYFNFKPGNSDVYYHFTFKEVINEIRDLAHQKGKKIEDCFKDVNSVDQNYVTDEYVNTWKDTKVLESIDPKDIDFEDTIVFLDTTGKWFVKKIDSGSTRDYYKNLFDWKGAKIYRWNTQGRDLLPSITKVNVNNHTYNLWDFDAERCCFYINEIINATKKDKLNKVLGLNQKKNFILRFHQNIDFNNIDLLKTILKQEQAKARETFLEYSEALRRNGVYQTYQSAFDSEKVREALNELWNLTVLNNNQLIDEINLRIINKFDPLTAIEAISKFALLKPELQETLYQRFPEAKAFKVTTDLGKPNVEFSQIICGKIHASKFGLPSGTNVAEILSQGESYFKNQIREKTASMYSQSLKRLYDIALYNSNGDIIYVTIGNNELNNNRWKQVQPTSNKFKSVDGYLYYNGDKLIESKNVQFGEFIENGKVYNMLYLKDYQTFDNIKRKMDFIFERYNHTQRNWRSTIKHQYRFAFDGDILTKNLYLKVNIKNKPYNIILKQGSNINNIEIPDIVRVLQNIEQNRIDKKIDELCKDSFAAFKKSLLYIGARIPSQSMQSYSGAEIINFTDSEENEVYMPRTITWVAGSDYDIDKWYMMGWSITDLGTIPTFKKLSGFSADEVVKLPKPTGIVYDYQINDKEINDSNIVNITEKELKDFENGNADALKKVLKSKATVINFVINDEINIANNLNGNLNDTLEWIFSTATNLDDSLILAQNFVKAVNDWNNESNSGTFLRAYADAIFKNNVVQSIQNALTDPSVQINLLTTLNMDAAKEVGASNIDVANRNKTLNADNPMSIFDQQYANMVGRTGIGAVAVAQKAFNTISFAFDSGVNTWAKKIRQSDDLYKDLSSLIDYLSVITFEGRLNNNSIRTIANINLRPLIFELASKQPDIIKNFRYLGSGELSPLLEQFRNKEDGTFDIIRYISELQKNSNVTNAMDLYSNLMSAATDNAKELLLEKLNAIGDFIDVYCYLFATGESFQDVGKFLTSPRFNVILKYTKSNIFEIGNDRINFKKALNFVNGTEDLGMIKSYLYNDSLVQKAFIDLIPNNKIDEIIRFFDIRNISGSLITAESFVKLMFDPNAYAEYTVSGKNIKLFESTFKNNLANWIKTKLFPVENGKYAKLYLNWLDKAIENAPVYQPKRNINPEDLWGDDAEYAESQISSANNAKYIGNEFSKANKEGLISLYRYVSEYVIPKNKRLQSAIVTEAKQSIDSSIDPNSIEYKEILKSRILELEDTQDEFFNKLLSIYNGASELSLLGQILAINQGMKANDYTEYNFIAKINSAINRNYLDYSTNNPDDSLNRFDLLRFIDDPEYQKEQIEQYDKVKNTFNVLRIIIASPHFLEMLNTVKTNREAITENSVSYNLVRKLATEVFDKAYSSADPNSLHNGLKYKLNEQELKRLSRAVDDLITYHFIVNTITTDNKLYFEVPESFKGYYWSGSSIVFNKLNKKTFDLHSYENIANFKRLMDTVIIPGLKNHPDFKNEMFIRMLAIDGKQDPKDGKIRRYYKLSIDNSANNPRSKAYSMYIKARDSFYKIAKWTIPSEILGNGSNWNIMDLFYLYNLVVSHEGFTSTGFSDIFSDAINQGLKTNLINTYNQYISDLDAGKIKIAEDNNVPLENNSVINYKINDIWYRLIDKTNDYKFNAKAYDKVITISQEGIGSISIDTDFNSHPEDFTFDFPSLFRDRNSFVPKWDGYKPRLNTKELYSVSTYDVVREVVRYMQDIFGETIPIKLINAADLAKWEKQKANMFKGDLTDFQKDRIKNSNGFIDNGIIYINTDSKDFNVGTTVHELSHIICADLKFNPKTKDLYYQLLNNVWNSKTEQEKKELEQMYSNKIGSDLKEEALAEAISRAFATNFSKGFGEPLIFGYELSDVVRDSLNRMFRMNIDKENYRMERIGETEIEDLFKIFNTELFNFDRHNFSRMHIILSQELATIKSRLTEYKCLEI